MLQKFRAMAPALLLIAGALVLLITPVGRAAAGVALLAAGLAFLLTPLCAALEKGLPRPLSAALCVILTAILLAGVAAAIVLPLVSQAGDMAGRLTREMERAAAFLQKLRLPWELPDLSRLELPENMLEKMALVCGRVASFTGNFAALCVKAAMAAVLAFYFLSDRRALLLRMELMIPPRFRERALRFAGEAGRDLFLYLRGQAVIALCVGGLSALGLTLVGVPAALPMGLLAGLLNMIPYFGPVIACVPVGLFALQRGLFTVALAIASLICVQQIDGLVLSPRIIGSATGFSPALVMVSLFAFGAAWGVAGMLLALPALILIRTCVRVFVESVRMD